MKSKINFGMSSSIFCAFGIFGCLESKTIEPEANYIETESTLSQVNVSSTLYDSAESIKNVRAAGEMAVPTICGTTSSIVGEKVVTKKEILRMGVINAKLKYMPEARKALNLVEVKTCAEAEAFIRYVTDNPESEKVFHVPQRSHDSQLHPVSRDSVLFPKTAAPLKKEAILGSIGASNKQGVVQIQYINGSYVGCTGYMITLNAMVTAAHCVDDFITSGSAAWATADIRYFDPNGSNPPSNPRQVSNNETVYIWMAPTYVGTGDTESDIAIIKSNVNWYGTTIYDLVRIYNGPFSNARNNYLWGQGYDSGNHTGIGTLRYEYMYIEWYGDHHFYTLAYNHRACGGDSGGPRFRSDNHQNLTLGHHCNSEKNSSSDACAAQGGKERSNKLPPKVNWIEDMLGVDCYFMNASSDNTPYRQCFQSW